MSGSSTLLIIVIIIAVICIIWYFSSNSGRPIKNSGSIGAADSSRATWGDGTPIDTDAQSVLDRYSAEREYGSDMQTYEDYSPFEEEIESEDMSEDCVEVNKKKYVRRSQRDIEKDFDVKSLLPDPKQKRDDWFETFHQQPTDKISGTQLIHPKELAGYSELREPLRNRSRDPRGDVFVPKVENYPWGNSVIVADRGNKGYCKGGC